jgi:hypothetical protein
LNVLNHLFGRGRGAALAGASLLAVLVCAASCGGPDKANSTGASTGAEIKTAAHFKRGGELVESIPFGELNEGEDYNATDVVALADSRFLFCDNKTSDALFELDLTPEGQKKGPLVRRPLKGIAAGAATDLEGMTLAEEGGRRYVIVSSSMYVKKAKKNNLEIPPSGLLRVTINPDDSLSAENMTGIRDWLVRAYPQLTPASVEKPDDDGLNIEGIAWDGARHAVLFGLRTPVPQGKPMILPVKVKDLAGPWTTADLEALPPIQLSIKQHDEEQGIRCLYNEQGRTGFLVMMGNSTSDSKAPFTLYEWNGAADNAPRRFNLSFAKKMKPEGVTRGMIGGKKALVIVDDRGGFLTLWDDRLTLDENSKQ